MSKKSTKLEQLSETIHIAVEDMKNLGIENLDQLFLEIYVEQSCQLTDSRQQEKVSHPLKDVGGDCFLCSPCRK